MDSKGLTFSKKQREDRRHSENEVPRIVWCAFWLETRRGQETFGE
jgi:hypothetical protein